MTKDEFLKDVENNQDEMVLEVVEHAESVFEELEAEIDELKDEVDDLELKIKGLEESVESLQEEVGGYESEVQYGVWGHHDNIVTRAVLDDLFNNFDDIPIQELQDFINKHKK